MLGCSRQRQSCKIETGSGRGDERAIDIGFERRAIEGQRNMLPHPLGQGRLCLLARPAAQLAHATGIEEPMVGASSLLAQQQEPRAVLRHVVDPDPRGDGMRRIARAQAGEVGQAQTVIAAIE